MLWRVLLVFLLHDGVLSTTSSSSMEEDQSMEEDSADQNPKSAPHGHWGYQDQDSWSSAFQHCSGKSQSPINVDTRKAIFDTRLAPIQLQGYDLTSKPALTLYNNGHTLQLSLPNTMHIVGGLKEVFFAAQLHFHWGTTEVPGSEHTIDDIHYPAEIHVVHYNSKYANLTEAASKHDGLVVLGGFIGIGLLENDNYEKILSALTDVSMEESDTEIPGFNVRHLLPNDLTRFYRYNGSLTTPPCFQTVHWTLFNDTIRVSRRQLAALEETLKCGHNKHLSRNFRAPQLLHGRRVFSSFRLSPTPGNTQIKQYSESDVSKRTKSSSSGPLETLSRGDVLAIVFGTLFAVTLLSFTVFAYRQRKKYSRFKKNDVYKLANKEEA